MLFATHYAALTAEYSSSKHVALGHMAAVVSGGPRGCTTPGEPHLSPKLELISKVYS